MRVLFVDDDELILSSLQDALHDMRRAWETVFVGSGADALREMEKQPFDVLVTDMRMPRMDGEELIRLTRARYPGTARLVLTGHAEASSMARTLPLAHQFLSKPCDTETLKSAIVRAGSARARLEDPALRTLIGKLGSLPAVPTVYLRLSEVMQQPGAGASSVARIIEQDPAICARVLQLANSSYYGRKSSIESVDAAVVQLGLQQLRGLALSAHLFVTLGSADDAPLLERVQQDALLTSRLARRFSPNPKLAEQAFTAALIHDAGVLVLARAFPEACRKISLEAEKRQHTLAALERAQFGATHAQVGGYLLGTWGLPAPIVDALALHQEPRSFESSSPQLTCVLHAASALAEAALEKLPPEQAALDPGFLQDNGMGAQLAVWRAIAAEELAGDKAA